MPTNGKPKKWIILDTLNLSKLSHDNTENLQRPITKADPLNQSPGQDGFIEFYLTFQELIPMLVKLFKGIQRGGILPNPF